MKIRIYFEQIKRYSFHVRLFCFFACLENKQCFWRKKEILIKLDAVGSLISFADIINRLLLKVAILWTFFVVIIYGMVRVWSILNKLYVTKIGTIKMRWFCDERPIRPFNKIGKKNLILVFCYQSIACWNVKTFK
jgi:hypothetical protein